MRNCMRFTIRALGYLMLLAWNAVHSDEDRWELLITHKTGNVYYDKQSFSSDREAVGVWLRMNRAGKSSADGYQLDRVRFECVKNGNFAIYNIREYAKDGRQLSNIDGYREVVIEPASGAEEMRNALCAKRPAWQRALSK